MDRMITCGYTNWGESVDLTNGKQMMQLHEAFNEKLKMEFSVVGHLKHFKTCGIISDPEDFTSKSKEEDY